MGCASWLLLAFPDLVCLSQRSEQGCAGHKRADELLSLSGSHWHPPALLLPDHPVTAVRVPPFSFTSAALESLKHSKHKKSREAEKAVLIVGFLSFFFLLLQCLCHMYEDHVKLNIG